MKWLIWWRDGDVTVWDARQWTAAQLVEMRNVVDAVLVSGAQAMDAARWWASDGANLHREMFVAELEMEAMANVGMLAV